MKRMQAYRFQLVTVPRQERQLASAAGCRRFVFNRALSMQKERLATGKKRLSYPELCKQLTNWRHDSKTSFLKEAPSQPLQQALKDLDRAYTNFFEGRAQPPCFQKKGQKERFRYPDGKQIKLDEKNSRIFLPKLGWFRYRNSRDVLGIVKNVTVSMESGKWYVSIQAEREVEIPASEEGSMVGIDVGVVRFATVSNGTVYEGPRSYRMYEKRLAKKQRELARKKKRSANWKKQVKRIAKLHKKVRNIRRDFQHKTSAIICKSHAVIVIEDLKVQAMSKSAKGTLESPGKRVKQKSGLNKSILDQGWYEFRRQLEYKSQWLGRKLVVVPARNTSLACANCQHVDKENRKTQSKFCCVECKYEDNADLNAAKNILAAGRAVLACGENPLGILMKQEPSVSVATVAA